MFVGKAILNLKKIEGKIQYDVYYDGELIAEIGLAEDETLNGYFFGQLMYMKYPMTKERFLQDPNHYLNEVCEAIIVMFCKKESGLYLEDYVFSIEK